MVYAAHGGDFAEHRYHGLGPNRREAPFAKVCRATLFEKFKKQGFKAVIVVRRGARTLHLERRYREYYKHEGFYFEYWAE